MQEILFKAKRKDNKEWVYGSGIIRVQKNTYDTDEYEIVKSVNYDELDYYIPSYDTEEIDINTLCQYTGIKDKNGVKIFENDIIKCHYANAIKDIHIEQVVFYKGKFMAYEKIDGTEHWTSLYDGISRLAIDKSVYIDDMEVIGNVFDEEVK